MLLKAEITNDVASNRDLLCEQLYIFLRDYVPKRLIYEDSYEIEDCIQDAIMYMLKRFDKLSNKEKKTKNLEKYFFNRANSFISAYIVKLKTRRASLKKYKDKYIRDITNTDNNTKYVELPLLDSIVEKYNLDKRRMHILKSISLLLLSNLGYEICDIEYTNLDETDADFTLRTLAYSVVDEYILEVTIQKGVG